ncbi:MAG: hypothetical protein HIU90_06690 [Proteobacteria bacterium]|nr:hypothetical protein [Pseudomonadota bacterium]
MRHDLPHVQSNTISRRAFEVMPRNRSFSRQSDLRVDLSAICDFPARILDFTVRTYLGIDAILLDRFNDCPRPQRMARVFTAGMQTARSASATFCDSRRGIARDPAATGAANRLARTRAFGVDRAAQMVHNAPDGDPH